MTARRLAAALGTLVLLGACEAPPTDPTKEPSFTSAFDDVMVQDWTHYEDYPVLIPCANGGAGAELFWTGDIAAFGRVHVTPTGTEHVVVKVEFRDVVFRSAIGELYPFKRVVQQNVLHTFENGHTIVHWPDNEFYTTPDGRNVNVRFLSHLNMREDGPPELERFTISCSPAKW